MTVLDEVVRCVRHHVKYNDMGVEAAIDRELSRMDSPVDSEDVLREYARRYERHDPAEVIEKVDHHGVATTLRHGPCGIEVEYDGDLIGNLRFEQVVALAAGDLGDLVPGADAAAAEIEEVLVRDEAVYDADALRTFVDAVQDGEN